MPMDEQPRSPSKGLVNGASTAELQELLSKDDEKYLREPSIDSRQRPSHVLEIFAAVLYGTVGLIMGFVNKAVLQQWPYSNSLLTCQMAATMVIVGLSSLTGYISIRPITLRAVRSLWGVVFFYNANVGFALAAVRVLSIPVYHVLKRLTPVMILIAKQLMGDPPPPTSITLSVVIVVIGCLLSGAGDLSFDLNGYLWAITSCVLQSAYLILVERTGTEKGYTSNELLMYNAVLSIPFLSALILFTGEAQPSFTDLYNQSSTSTSFFITFVVSLLMGVLLNYSLFLCTMVNNALTTTIVGALRSVFGTILGFFVLGGVKATVLIVLGCAVNTVGGVWYTWIKYGMKVKKQGGDEEMAMKPTVSRSTGTPMLL